MDIRLPTDRQVQYLARIGVTQEANPQAYASREAASAAIEANEVVLNAEGASEAQIAKLATIGIALGWQPKRLPGATRRHISLHIAVCEALDRVERAETQEQRRALLADMCADLKRRCASPVFKETRVLRVVEPAEQGEPAPF